MLREWNLYALKDTHHSLAQTYDYELGALKLILNQDNILEETISSVTI